MERLSVKRLLLFNLLLLLVASVGTYAVDSDSGGGDVTVNVGETVVMTVSAPQNFTAITEADISAGTLTVTDNDGNADQETKIIQVLPR